MSRFPPEVWHQIAGDVYAAGDLETLLTMSSLSSSIHIQTNLWLYHDITLDMRKAHQILGFISNLGDANAAYIRSLTILPNDDVANRLPAGTLEGLVRTLPKLRIFSWFCSLAIGEPLLRVLEDRSNISEVRVFYQVGTRLERSFPFSTPCPSWKLTRLELLIEWDWSGQGNMNSQLCQIAILNAPSLVVLDVMFQYPADSQELDDHNRTLGTLNFYTAQRLPTIKSLTLYGYTVGLGRGNEMEHRIQTSALRELVLTPGPGSNLEVFLTSMMNSGEIHLEVLELRWNFPGMIDSFAHQWVPFFTGFLQHFKGLKKLVLTGDIMKPLNDLSNGISWHGETLEELMLHSATYASWLLHRPRRSALKLAVQGIETLVNTCPRLRKLSLDLYFGDDLALQRTFQRFQALEKLVIYTGCYDEWGHPCPPHANAQYVYALAVQLRSSSLREVILHVASLLTAFTARHTPNAELENRHRRVWHMEYPKNDSSDANIKVWRSV
ncbi:hypothetical protein BDR22DRAFT_887077 [Usnea florida]